VIDHQQLNPKRDLIEDFIKMESYLLTWKRLESLKSFWARLKLGTERISSSESFEKFK
jgi:hypothetical protein